MVTGTRPWLDGDHSMVEQDVNHYLVDHGAESRPPHFTWFYVGDFSEIVSVASELQTRDHQDVQASELERELSARGLI